MFSMFAYRAACVRIANSAMWFVQRKPKVPELYKKNNATRPVVPVVRPELQT